MGCRGEGRYRMAKRGHGKNEKIQAGTERQTLINTDTAAYRGFNGAAGSIKEAAGSISAAAPRTFQEDATVYGYARVSARDQSLNRQLDALRTFPISEGNIYRDQASGKDFKRPGYQRLVRKIRSGDIVVIKSIDRLGRNYNEILHEWRSLTQEKRVRMVVLDMPLLDMRVANGDITGVFLADMVLQLLSYVAQVERENIRQRQAEGIAAARARGVRFGRPILSKPSCYGNVRDAYVAGDITRAQAAVRLGVCVRTFDKWLKEE